MNVPYELIQTDHYPYCRAVVVCPRCGKEGRLIPRRSRSSTMIGYKVEHRVGGRRSTCSFGWTSEGWEKLDAIYHEVLTAREERRAALQALYDATPALYWRVAERMGKLTIVVQCPACGREGTLQKDGSRLKVHHDNGDVCPIGKKHPAYGDLWAVYCEVRRTPHQEGAVRPLVEVVA